ncbi:MAG: dienelactone hydrolase [Prochloraceae cyanobacterium]|nr:dienelactone hydrolase [Prochloraceae cyanobacterium]
MIIRSLWRASKIESLQPPYNTIHLKVFYPAEESQGKKQIFPSVNKEKAPFPVVIFFSGGNCNLENYQWLAVELSKRGTIAVLFNWVGEVLPGLVGLIPGVNLAIRKPDVYGTTPTAIALPSILNELENLNSQGVLAGAIDSEKIVLGGHSGGGRVALENADPSFFPTVKAAFAYGAHSAGRLDLGYEPETFLSLPSSLPMLLLGGSLDGIMANASNSYGVSEWETPYTPIIRTFKEAISSKRNDVYLAIVEGASSYSICDRKDSTFSISDTDFTPTRSTAEIHSFLAEIISLFIDYHIRQEISAFQKLSELLTTDNPIIAHFDRK